MLINPLRAMLVGTSINSRSSLSDHSHQSRGRDRRPDKEQPLVGQVEGVRDGLITHPLKAAIEYGNSEALCATWLKEEQCELKVNK